MRGTCNNNRNLSDEQIRRIAKKEGLIGIGFWPTAVCGNDPKSIVRAIRHVTDLVGVEHVALGSDFDGAVTTPFDTSGVVEITEALMSAGYTPEQIRRIMGETRCSSCRRIYPELSS